MNRIIIEFGKFTSEKDVEDLKLLLEDIKDRFYFRWHLDTYKLSQQKAVDKNV
jgi:hypothetical protein